MQELNEELQAAKESAKAAKGQESSLKEEVNGLNQDLQRSQRAQRRLQSEKEAREQEIQELKQQIKRLSSALQVGGWNGIWSSARCAFVCNRPLGSAFRLSALEKLWLHFPGHSFVISLLIVCANYPPGFTKDPIHP